MTASLSFVPAVQNREQGGRLEILEYAIDGLPLRNLVRVYGTMADMVSPFHWLEARWQEEAADRLMLLSPGDLPSGRVSRYC